MAASGTEAWLDLLEETRDGLAVLSPDRLEAVAERAAAVLAANLGPLRDSGLRRIAAEQRLLGDVLQATAANLDVLRRLRERAGPPWER